MQENQFHNIEVHNKKTQEKLSIKWNKLPHSTKPGAVAQFNINTRGIAIIQREKPTIRSNADVIDWLCEKTGLTPDCFGLLGKMKDFDFKVDNEQWTPQFGTRKVSTKIHEINTPQVIDNHPFSNPL